MKETKMKEMKPAKHVNGGLFLHRKSLYFSKVALDMMGIGEGSTATIYYNDNPVMIGVKPEGAGNIISSGQQMAMAAESKKMVLGGYLFDKEDEGIYLFKREGGTHAY